MTDERLDRIFRAYDIRGVVPDAFDAPLARQIANAIVVFLEAEQLVVGHDVRDTSDEIAAAVREGVLDAGCDLIELGLCTTPMATFAVEHFDTDGAIMITASHNPPEYNGLKVSREQGRPVGSETGLETIKQTVSEGGYREDPERGTARSENLVDAYRAHLQSVAGDTIPPLHLVIDSANGATGPFVQTLLKPFECRITGLYLEPDGAFPNHEANPVKAENLVDCIERVKKEGADLGVAFDGDGDRCVFIDETGRAVSADRITALLGRRAIRQADGGKVVIDLRSSQAVSELIEEAGGEVIRSRVGHAFIKDVMREHDAAVGGELSGHYYFRDHCYADSAFVALVKMLSLLGETGEPLSRLVRELDRYEQSGEVNFRVDAPDATIERLASTFSDGEQDRLDGLTVRYEDWWFNVRKSNTEPVLRLNVEADTLERLQEKQGQLESLIAD